MKMVKSLLLGSAAGLVAVAGAQAADLPVKAKPVEYVKVCSLYGAGYYYIPGTDICMKIGGYIRQEWSYGYGDNMTSGPWVSTSMQNTRIGGARDTVWRTRAYVTSETRQQTAYGTLRTYLTLGINGNNSTDFSSNRAFIQIAGFTVGLASSYFDHYSVAAIGYLVDQSSDTGDGGQRVFAYTAQLGNGVSASLSAEEPEAKRAGLWNTGMNSFAVAARTGKNAGSLFEQAFTGPQLGIAGTTQAIQDQKKSIAPDIVANLRVDQAWGTAQIMGALHEVSPGYNGASMTGAQGNGHPDDKWGWAAGASIKLNMPMIGPGDYVAAQVAYTEGAVRYVSNTGGGSGQAAFKGGDEVGYGFWSDGVFCGTAGSTSADPNTCPSGNTEVQLTTAWGVAAGWEHFWTPSLRTSFHGSYLDVRYNNIANAAICSSQSVLNTGFTGGGAPAGSIDLLPPGQGGNTISFVNNGAHGTCDNNWSMYQVGSRTQWNVTKDFYMGFDVVYYHLNTASKGAVVNYSALGGQAQPAPSSGAPTVGGALRTVADQDAVAVRVRWHRDIVP